MSQQQWRMYIKAVPRKPASIDLLVAAIMAMGEQLHAEQRAANRQAVETQASEPDSGQGATS